MNGIVLAGAALLLGACAGRAPVATPSAGDGAAVRALDAGWARTYQVHDTAYALALFSDDFVMTSANGGLKDRAAELADIRPQPNLRMDYFRTRDVQVRAWGDAAVVNGVAEWSFTYNGQPSQVARRYTATYIRGGQLGWRMVALHMGRAP